jgi:hypothetical protein
MGARLSRIDAVVFVAELDGNAVGDDRVLRAGRILRA